MMRVRDIVRDTFTSTDLNYEAYGYYFGTYMTLPFKTFTEAHVTAESYNALEREGININRRVR